LRSQHTIVFTFFVHQKRFEAMQAGDGVRHTVAEVMAEEPAGRRRKLTPRAELDMAMPEGPDVTMVYLIARRRWQACVIGSATPT